MSFVDPILRTASSLAKLDVATSLGILATEKVSPTILLGLSFDPPPLVPPNLYFLL
jgi:hypothetical protein